MGRQYRSGIVKVNSLKEHGKRVSARERTLAVAIASWLMNCNLSPYLVATVWCLLSLYEEYATIFNSGT
jgi:hypothetical protein